MVVKLNILEGNPMEELKKTENLRNRVKTAIYFTAVSIWIIGAICILACWQKTPSPVDFFVTDIGDEGVNEVQSKIGKTSNISISISNAEHLTSDVNVGDYRHSENIEQSTNEPVNNKLDTSTTESSSSSSTEINRNTENATKDLIREAIAKDDATETKVLVTNLCKNFDGNEDIIPLNAAAQQCKNNVAEMLIENGANVNIVGQYGWRPIHVATFHDCDKIVEMLIKHGADINSKVTIGYTALHIAAHNGRDRIAQLLIDNGADVQIRDSGYSHITALEWAKSRGHENVAKVITAHLASLKATTTTEPTSYESIEDSWESGESIVEKRLFNGRSNIRKWNPLECSEEESGEEK